MQQYSDFIYYSGTNTPVVGEPVTVKDSGTDTVSAIYNSAGVAIDNPVYTDIHGGFDFYVVDNLDFDIYVQSVKYDSFSSRVNTDKADKNNTILTATAIGDALQVQSTGEINVFSNLSVNGNAAVSGNAFVGGVLQANAAVISSTFSAPTISCNNLTVGTSANIPRIDVGGHGSVIVIDDVEIVANDGAGNYSQVIARDTGNLDLYYTGLLALNSIPLTPTATELNYMDGVTSAVQTQLGGKVPTTSTTLNTVSTVDHSNGNFNVNTDYVDGPSTYASFINTVPGYIALYAGGNGLSDVGISAEYGQLKLLGPSFRAVTYGTEVLHTAPSSAIAAGAIGEIRITSGYIYVCTATNTWKRAALTTW